MSDSTTRTSSDDIDTILAMIQDYFDGLYEGDTEKLAAIFHADTVLKAPGLRRSRNEWFRDVASRRVPQRENEAYRFKIIAIDIVEHQAMVKVECPLFENFYVDYLGFLKESGQWQIVNKMYAAI